MRSNELDGIKGILIIGVVIIHSRFTYLEGIHPFIDGLIKILDPAVMAFFLINGFLSAKSRKKGAKMIQKSAQLFLMGFGWSLAYYLIFVALGRVELSLRGVIFSSMEGPAFQMYFLVYLSGLGVVFGVARWLKFERFLPFVLFAGAVALYLVSDRPLIGHGSSGLPFYISAYAIGLLGSRMREVVGFPKASAFGVLAVAFVGAALSVDGVIRPFVSLAFLLLGVLLYPPKLGRVDLLAGIGLSSLWIYLLHTPILAPAVFRGVNLLVGIDGLTWTLGLGGTVAVCLFAHRAWGLVSQRLRAVGKIRRQISS
ncbi:MAG: acyltransferase family protein [Verrucomicrobiales bacterium]